MGTEDGDLIPPARACSAGSVVGSQSYTKYSLCASIDKESTVQILSFVVRPSFTGELPCHFDWISVMEPTRTIV